MIPGKRTLRIARIFILGSLALTTATAPLAAQQTRLTSSVRTRIEHWRWFESSANSDYTFGAVLARAGLARQANRFGWNVELAAPMLLGLPDDATAPPPQGQLGLGPSYWAANDSSSSAFGLFLKQAFVRFGAPPDSAGHALRIGRFEFIDGAEKTPRQPVLAALKRDRIAHRLIGNYSFSHAQRSADGLHYTFDAAAAHLTAVAFLPTQGVLKVNGWPNLDVGVLYTALSAPARANQRADWRMFGIYYHDYRDDPVPLKTDNRTTAERQQDDEPIDVATVGAHYLRVFELGRTSIDLLGWTALQFGDWGTLEHRAHAFSVELGVQPAWPGKPWLRVGTTRSSGDASATDTKHGTFLQPLPTPRQYARFPFFNMMNVEDDFVSWSLAPVANLTLRADAHRLRLAEPRDLWYGGGGASDDRGFGFSGRPSNGQVSLGHLLDLSAQWRWSNTLSAYAYLGAARGGGVIEQIHPAGNNALLGYIELEWRR